MKLPKIWKALMLLSMALIADAAPKDIPVKVVVLESSTERTIIRYEIKPEKFKTTEVDVNGKSYQSWSLRKERTLNTKGDPMLPCISRSIIISDDAEVQVNVLSSEYIEFTDTLIVPSKGPLSRLINPNDVPYIFGDAYAKDEFYPSTLVSPRAPYIMRDFRGVVVDLFAFQYNPIEETLRIYTTVTLEVLNTGVISKNSLAKSKNRKEGKQDRKLTKEFDGIYGRHFLNYTPTKRNSRFSKPSEIKTRSDSDSTVSPVRSSNLISEPMRDVPVVETEGEMLIITHDAFATEMAPFIEWKRQKGMKTTMVNVSEVGNTVSNIRNYVQNFYDNSNLTYVLLVGDAKQVAAGDTQQDPVMAKVAGDDNYPDIFVGRFSAESVSDVQTQVQRTIDYEKNIQSGAWLTKAIGIGSSKDKKWGHNHEIDYEHIDLIRTDLLSYTYTLVDQFYDRGDGNPPQTSAVLAAINEGRGFINYAGHGWQDGWATSTFLDNQVNMLHNSGMLPFVLTAGCNVGAFGTNTCMAEAWARATDSSTGEPTGSIANYSSSISQSWAAPMHAQDEFTDLLIAEAKTTFGALCFNAACKMMDLSGETGVNEFDAWHVFGDPSLQVRTAEPMAMTVTHSGAMDVMDKTYPVTVPGVAGAFCALYYNGTVYGSGYTDVDGNANIALVNIFPSDIDLLLTVTGFNKITVQETISITGILPNYKALAIDDSYIALLNEVLTVVAPGALGNDTDINQDTLTAVLVNDASNGTLVLNEDGSFTYTPDINYLGTDSFTYKANDGTEDSNIATVTIKTIEWFPNLISGSSLWLDANDIDGDGTPEGLSETGLLGSHISVWADKSGSGNNAIQSADTARASLVLDTMNGRPVAQFDGANDFMSFTRITDIRTVFWVVKEDAGATEKRFLLGDSGLYQFHRGIDEAPSTFWHSVHTHQNIRNGTTRLNGASVDGLVATVPAGENCLVSLVTAGNVKANQLTRDRADTTRSWDGDIAEIIIYNKALTSAEVERVEAYLNKKWLPVPLTLTLTTAYQADGANLIFNWQSVPGKSYSLLSCTNLTDESWSVVTTVFATEPMHTITAKADDVKCFYRIELE